MLRIPACHQLQLIATVKAASRCGPDIDYNTMQTPAQKHSGGDPVAVGSLNMHTPTTFYRVSTNLTEQISRRL